MATNKRTGGNTNSRASVSANNRYSGPTPLPSLQPKPRYVPQGTAFTVSRDQEPTVSWMDQFDRRSTATDNAYPQNPRGHAAISTDGQIINQRPPANWRPGWDGSERSGSSRTPKKR
jgi:hypothetical protein